MKAIKYIGLVIVGLVVVVLLLFCGLVLFFDPNNYKADIERIAKEKANIELHIEGNIRWTFYPWLGISLQETSVASVETPTKPFAKVKELDLSVRLMPLFQGQIKMNDININGLTVDLFKDEEGNSNWSKVGEVAKTTDQTKVETKTPETPSEQGEVSKKINLDVNSITINNTKFNYKDLKTRQEFAITDVHLSTGAIHDGEPVLINLGANFANKKPMLKTSMQLLGKFIYDLDKQQYKIADMHLNSDMTGDPLNHKTIKLFAEGDLSADLKANTAQWDRLSLGVDVLKVTGAIKATNILKAPHIQGQLTAADFDLQKLLADLGMKAPAMASNEALTKIGFSTDLNVTTKNLALDNLKIKLDSTNIEGQVAVTDFVKLAIKAQLKGDTINVDNYLPPEVKQTAQTNKALAENGGSTSSNKAIWSSEVLFDIRSLKGINLDIDFAMNQLTAKKLPWQQFGLKVIAKNGVINLQKFGGNLFTGSVSVLGSINVNAQLPQVSLKPTIKNVPVEKLLSVLDQNVPLKGAMSLTGNFKTSGISQLNLVKNLSGNANFAVDDGYLVGINLEEPLCKGIALLNKKQLATNYSTKDTKFDQLKAAVTITNGVANNPDLILAIPGLVTKGKGTFNIVTMTADYHVGVVVKGDLKENADPACKVNEKFADAEFPLLCRGSVLSGGNICGIDLEGVNKLIVRFGGEKVKEKLTKELDKKLEGKLGKKLEDKPALKGLLNKGLKGIVK